MRFHWTEKLDLRVLFVGGLLLTIGFLFRAQVYDRLPRILEGCFYLGGLLLLACHNPLRQMLEALPRPQQRGLFWLVGLMVAAQLLSQKQNTFPVIPWAMYTKRLPNPPEYYEYTGICDDGREVLIPSMQVFRSQHRTLPWRLHTFDQFNIAIKTNTVPSRNDSDLFATVFHH